jgi:hypothetical protein
MQWAENVARMRIGAYQIVGKREEKGHLEDVCISVTLILIWIFKQWDGEEWNGWV